jgi:hypothetical protein
MKIVIGIQTCDRLNYTKQVVESILIHNPETREMPWVFCDDASAIDTKKYINSLDFVKSFSFLPVRNGITIGLKTLVKVAGVYGDVILYIQNDWKQVRTIDFKAIETFFGKYPNAGHLQTIKYKGEGTDRPSSTAMSVNLHTKEKIIPGKEILIGKEKIIPGNWHYCDLPGFSRISFAKNMFDGRLDESVRVKHFSTCGCDNYLLENQPYRNIDLDGKGRTFKRKL